MCRYASKPRNPTHTYSKPIMIIPKKLWKIYVFSPCYCIIFTATCAVSTNSHIKIREQKSQSCNLFKHFYHSENNQAIWQLAFLPEIRVFFKIFKKRLDFFKWIVYNNLAIEKQHFIWPYVELSERPKEQHWKCCVPFWYRGFKSLTLRHRKAGYHPMPCFSIPFCVECGIWRRPYQDVSVSAHRRWKWYSVSFSGRAAKAIRQEVSLRRRGIRTPNHHADPLYAI